MQNEALTVVYEDQNYLAINKPAGLIVHASVDKKRPHLWGMAQAQFGPHLTLHHRLDKDTSGVVLLSKSDQGKEALVEIFEKRQIQKIYWAIVHWPKLENDGQGAGDWVDYVKIAKDQGHEKLVKVAKGGMVAKSRFQLIKKWGDDFALIQVELLTGRRHQVRAQCSFRGMPIVGDTFYGSSLKTSRFLLHAHSLSFFDPLTQKNISIKAQAPSDFEQFSPPSEKKQIAFYCPYGTLSQFTSKLNQSTLASFDLPSGFYPAGRLDKDSEGLLILSGDGDFIHRLSSPKFNKEKKYWVLVEGLPADRALECLRKGGLKIQDYLTKVCQVRLLNSEEIKNIPSGGPAIRQRLNIPTTWLEIIVTEGKNRQVRRMTAAVGHPTLRLIRVQVGKFNLLNSNLTPGGWMWVKDSDIV